MISPRRRARARGLDFTNSYIRVPGSYIVSLLPQNAKSNDDIPGNVLNSSKTGAVTRRAFVRRDANATAINSADRIVKFERDRERERENVYAGHRCRRRRCRRCLKRGFYSGSGTNPTARMVGIVALGQPDNHNWTGRFNEPHARRIPPPLPSASHPRMVI